jgi:hypothetical protein
MTVGEIFTTAGVGGLIVTIVLLSAATVYVVLTRWILQGGKEDKPPWEQMGWPFE